MRWCRNAVALVAMLALGAQTPTAHCADGALRMRDGDSLSAEADAAFHDIGDEGLTVEGWFWLDELPAVGEVQTFFANPSKYAMGVGISKVNWDADEWFDPGEARSFGFLWTYEVMGSTHVGIMGDADHRNPPVKEWFHVAMQFHAKPPHMGWIFKHKQALPFASDEDFPWALAAGDEALYVATPELGIRDFGVVADTDVTVFKGLVDAVRVSNIARYDGRDAVRPRHLRGDKHTVALWTFDGAQPFADKSGNGHDLVGDGEIEPSPLAVRARGKLATTWAGMKGAAR